MSDRLSPEMVPAASPEAEQAPPPRPGTMEDLAQALQTTHLPEQTRRIVEAARRRGAREGGRT